MSGDNKILCNISGELLLSGELLFERCASVCVCVCVCVCGVQSGPEVRGGLQAILVKENLQNFLLENVDTANSFSNLYLS
jgi:hypothetical protein